MEKKDLNEILTRMKSGDNVPVFKVSSTDFTPKKKPSFKVRFKKIVTNITSSIKKFKFLMKIKKWFDETITQPIKAKKAKRAHDKYIKELKENFSKKFNINVDKTIMIMNGPGYSPENIDSSDLLIKNSIEINKTKDILGNRISPFLYEPDIIDIHNENLSLNEDNPTFQELIHIENEKASASVFDQYEFFRKRPHLIAPDRYKKTNSRR